MPGTYNFKKDSKRLVQTLPAPHTVKTWLQFRTILDNAVTENHITVNPVTTAEPRPTDELGENLTVFKDTAPTFETLMSVCNQVRTNYDNQANVSEPAWFHTLNCVRFCKDADEAIHTVSKLHPGYDREETILKVENQKASGAGPTTCLKFQEICGEAACSSCPHLGKIKSPLVAAAQFSVAPPPVIINPETGEKEQLPPLPAGYQRLTGGGIGKQLKEKDGTSYVETLYDLDLFLVRRTTCVDVETGEPKDGSVWRVMLPKEGMRDFTIPTKTIYDPNLLQGYLGDRGVMIDPDQSKMMRSFMIAYLKELQKTEAAEKKSMHFGWSDDFSHFTLADKSYWRDGSTKPVILGESAASVGQHLVKAGTLEKQVELMQFYNRDEYLPHQFYMGGSLGAILLFLTGQHGLAQNAYGEPGASKTTCLKTAASFWGHPVDLMLNGTKDGATAKARQEIMAIMANLPLCSDEHTHLAAKDAANLFLNVSQKGQRIRLTTKANVKAPVVSQKSTYLMMTANASMHSVMAMENTASTAGSMRIIEIVFKPTNVHTKPEADAYLRDLTENYGHIGEEFIKYVVTHFEECQKRVIDRMAEVDIKGNISASERYWSSCIAVNTVSLEIAHELKLLPWDPAKVYNWAMTKQLPYMREVVREEYATPVSYLNDFIAQEAGKFVVVQEAAKGNVLTEMNVNLTKSELVGRWEKKNNTLWIVESKFRDYVVYEKRGDWKKTLKDLMEDHVNAIPQPIVLKKQEKKHLAANTGLVDTQQRCLRIDMSHPEMNGAKPTIVSSNPDVATTPPNGVLKVVD